MKKHYQSPCILSRTSVETEQGILSGSVMENIEVVETTGHEVQNVDWSDPAQNFNHEWN